VTVLAIHKWKDNAELIADCAKLGYLEGKVLDPTWGEGNFWTRYRPKILIGTDAVTPKSPIGYSVDFRHQPWADQEFDSVVFDPPYKLNGTPDPEWDEKYGVHIPTRWQDRMALIRDGAVECARIAKTYLLVKVQDQVSSGKIRWQTDEVTNAVLPLGFEKHDRFDFLSYRAQPEGRSQKHAHRCSSQLLVFKRI